MGKPQWVCTEPFCLPVVPLVSVIISYRSYKSTSKYPRHPYFPFPPLLPQESALILSPPRSPQTRGIGNERPPPPHYRNGGEGFHPPTSLVHPTKNRALDSFRF